MLFAVCYELVFDCVCVHLEAWLVFRLLLSLCSADACCEKHFDGDVYVYVHRYNVLRCSCESRCERYYLCVHVWYLCVSTHARAACRDRMIACPIDIETIANRSTHCVNLMTIMQSFFLLFGTWFGVYAVCLSLCSASDFGSCQFVHEPLEKYFLTACELIGMIIAH